ncbi:exonuclease domain-containing protein [Glycomyces arizonensis]|uniref:exonuclease domain-containing protein n=1 Tax=Glycomyces arizonensis TaxID=256035 RepID=UPI0004255EDD|nr:exonuclease domain-containing protein [Glycomyces arizonensis]
MYAVFDLETTGLYNRDRIVEVAIAHVDADGHVTDRWTTLVNPQRDVGPQPLHGIRSADVRRAPTFAQIAGEVLARLAGRIPVAHNLSFDGRMLAQECLRMGLEIPRLSEYGVCTMSWASHFLPGVQRTLAHCCEAAGIGNDRPHEALSDVMATAELLTFYLGSTSVVPPWDDLRALVAQLEWPAVPIGAAEPVRRGAGASDGADFLARLVEHLPAVPDPPQADMYLALLDRALLDRHVSATESDELVGLALDMGISRQAAIELHRGYLGALAAAALEDGVVTEAERDDLGRVAALLSLTAEDVDRALQPAEAPVAAPSRFALRRGDTVVLTGSFAESKQYWAERLAEAGLHVSGTVTKKTGLVIAADPDSMSGKATKARRYGIPVVGVEAVDLVLARLQ